MTDKELLELAAKAAGMLDELKWETKADIGLTDACIIDLPPERHHFYFKNKHPYTEWNPLTDDGDALRLAVKLKLQITPPFVDTARVTTHPLSKDGGYFKTEVLDGDPYAATRRAIVRAAAEIGKE